MIKTPINGKKEFRCPNHYLYVSNVVRNAVDGGRENISKEKGR
ncbi:MAG: hypothetical protein ACLFUR_05975 [Candidatus Hadarchaeia archaeon]